MQRINRSVSHGFALPTVLIASIVMFLVLVSTVSATSTISVAINDQAYDRLVQEAAESGLAYAKHCMAVGGVTWSTTSPLRPNTDCNGTPLAGVDCSSTSTDDRCYVHGSPLMTSSFIVEGDTGVAGAVNLLSKGLVNLRRSSTGTVWRTIGDNVRLIETASSGSASGASSAYEILSAGELHTCYTNGKVYCWGSNAYGQIGDGTTTLRTTPTAVSTSGVFSDKSVKSVPVGEYTNCAIGSDNNAYCWGRNSSGQLGVGSTTHSYVPIAVSTAGALNGKTILDVSANEYHACAIASDNKAYCWGGNIDGQLGDGSTLTRTLPVAVSTAGVLNGVNLTRITTGETHTCALDNLGKAYCWGNNSDGQLGNLNTSDSSFPVAVSVTGSLSGKTLIDIVANQDFTCALDSVGIVHCWGVNSEGQLGRGTTTNSSSPASIVMSGVLSGKVIKSIAGGEKYACVLTTEGRAYCWGGNLDGQLGDGTMTDRTTPVAVTTSGALNGKALTFIATGETHTCAASNEIAIYCWGEGSNGQLGNGGTSDSILPVLVNLSGVTPGVTSTFTIIY